MQYGGPPQFKYTSATRIHWNNNQKKLMINNQVLLVSSTPNFISYPRVTVSNSQSWVWTLETLFWEAKLYISESQQLHVSWLDIFNKVRVKMEQV